MVLDVMNAISVRLYEEFEGAYPIYGDADVLQNFNVPCFFIALLAPEQSPFPSGRYYRRQPFMVHFFPEKEEDRAELMDIGDRLFPALEYITMANGDILRGTDMGYEIQDGKLFFQVSYNMFLRYEPEETDEMETLKYTGRVEDS